MSSPSVYLLASIRLGNLVVIHSSDAGTRGPGMADYTQLLLMDQLK